ncbi:group 1 glycosyl transferase [Halobacteriales archaeon QS_8_69_26]|nr:MAG: group 1 glycosyl transferase [Halobacteriales archaeon QS_8_69_26]
MRVRFLPDYSNGNPYQSRLAEALEETGVSVRMGSDGPLAILESAWSGSDLVHFHWLHPFVDSRVLPVAVVKATLTLVQLILAKLFGISIVWTAHNVVSHDAFHPRLEHVCKHAIVRWFCDGVVVHCEAAVGELTDELSLPASTRDRVTVVPHGNYIGVYENDVSATEARSELGIDPERRVLLYFGRIRPYKGILDLLDAYERTDLPGTELVIAGAPKSPHEELADTVERRAEDLEKVRAHVKFIPDDEIQVYMNAADTVVLPYLSVSTSGAAVLAMSFGRAVVAPRLGCLPELLDEQGSAVYDISDSEGLERALQSVVKRDATKMGEYNRSRIEEFDWRAIAADISTAYENHAR